MVAGYKVNIQKLIVFIFSNYKHTVYSHGETSTVGEGSGEEKYYKMIQ